MFHLHADVGLGQKLSHPLLHLLFSPSLDVPWVVCAPGGAVVREVVPDELFLFGVSQFASDDEIRDDLDLGFAFHGVDVRGIELFLVATDQ